MNKQVSIRMRASRNAGERRPEIPARVSGPGGSGRKETHISGAEGIYAESEIPKVVSAYVKRALRHSRGKPDSISITVEAIEQKPLGISLLPVVTADCKSTADAKRFVRHLLASAGISDSAVTAALHILQKGETMRGAALLTAVSGTRVEPDPQRGIRVSRFGIGTAAEKAFSRKLARKGINHLRIKEAVVLASKVAACSRIIAELCISDDPEYTTGYIASRRHGYVRIPHMKKKDVSRGGRVFFVEEDADPRPVIQFLERTPVLAARTGECRGVYPADEIISGHYR